MERLTFEGNFCEIAQCACMRRLYDTACSQKQVWERLKAYEDSGLTPEEIKAPFTEDAMINLAAQALGVEPSRLRELAVADKDGHVIRLPCKVGKNVFLTREEAEKALAEMEGRKDG